MPSFTSWQTQQYPAGGSPQDIDLVQPGWSPTARDGLDFARLALSKRTPEAQYPDGYLSEPPSRRQRMYESTPTPSRLTSQRGVHKVDSVPRSDYFWPDEMSPFIGLELQARGKKYVTPGVVRDAYGDGTTESTSTAARVDTLRGMAPGWSTGMRMQAPQTNSYTN